MYQGKTRKRQTMRIRSHRIRVALLGCAIALVLSCASTVLVDVWKDPSLPAPRLSRMLVIAMRNNPIRRRLWEEAFVAELAQYGVTATPSYSLFPDAIPDTNQLRDAVTGGSFNGILVTHPLPPVTSTNYVPGYTSTEAHLVYNPWKKQYFTYYQDVTHPAYVDSTAVFRHEVDVLMPGDQGQMVWTGTSATPEPKTMDGLRHDVAGLVVKTLSKQAIIPSRQR